MTSRIRRCKQNPFQSGTAVHLRRPYAPHHISAEPIHGEKRTRNFWRFIVILYGFTKDMRRFAPPGVCKKFRNRYSSHSLLLLLTDIFQNHRRIGRKRDVKTPVVHLVALWFQGIGIRRCKQNPFQSLIADDEDMTRSGMEKYIRLHTDRFSKIYTAKNGQEALENIRGTDGFQHVILRPIMQRLLRIFKLLKPAENDCLRQNVHRLRLSHNVQTAFQRHLYIQKHHIRPVRKNNFKRLLSVLCRINF